MGCSRRRDCGRHQRPRCRPQSRLRLHPVLEAGRRDFLGGGGGLPRDNVTVLENGGQASHRRCLEDYPAACLQGLRYAYVRPHREQGPSVLWSGLHPSGALYGKRLGSSDVRGVRVLGDRSGVNPSEMTAIRSRLKELGSSLTLSVTGLDGCDRHACGEIQLESSLIQAFTSALAGGRYHREAAVSRGRSGKSGALTGVSGALLGPMIGSGEAGRGCAAGIARPWR